VQKNTEIPIGIGAMRFLSQQEIPKDAVRKRMIVRELDEVAAAQTYERNEVPYLEFWEYAETESQ
jgi:hypothetical protein